MTPLLQLTLERTETLMDAWFEAELQAVAAYRRWARDHEPESYAIYRAYADRADAAQDELAAASGHGFA
jgi:hypothetical protein